MIGKLITLPLRVSLRTGEMALRGALEVTQGAIQAGEQVLRLVRPGGDDGGASHAPSGDSAQARWRSAEEDRAAGQPGEGAPQRSSDRSAPIPRDPRRAENVNGGAPSTDDAPAASATPAADAPAASTTTPGGAPEVEIDFDRPGPLDPDAGHVSEEPALVEERADPGVKDGVGAQIRIDEPWPGYGQMKVREILPRLAEADAATLAALRLYEASHRSRESVLRAIDRQLRLNQHGSSPDSERTT